MKAVRLAALALLGLAATAQAHRPSDSFLTVYLDRQPVAARWDIALRDLEYAIGLDADGDGTITWGELKARHDAIATYAADRLEIGAAAGPCTPTPGPQQVADHGDGAYTVLPLVIECPASAPPERLAYRLFFDLDPTHRGLVRIEDAGGSRSAVLSPGSGEFRLKAGPRGARWTFVEYWKEGVWHIWIGFDHILFLLALLLPSVLSFANGRWRPVGSLGPALREVVAVVTAFTLAHSITLTLAVLDWVALPARWVESAIAATVVLAALNNLYPLVPARRWVIAFALGLIHGLGFASVLAELGLPAGALVPALAGFNLGVEAGQLAIVAFFVPVAYLVRNTPLYQRGAVGFGSTAVATLAGLWLVERSLDLRLLNF